MELASKAMLAAGAGVIAAMVGLCIAQKVRTMILEKNGPKMYQVLGEESECKLMDNGHALYAAIQRSDLSAEVLHNIGADTMLLDTDELDLVPDFEQTYGVSALYAEVQDSDHPTQVLQNELDPESELELDAESELEEVQNVPALHAALQGSDFTEQVLHNELTILNTGSVLELLDQDYDFYTELQYADCSGQVLHDENANTMLMAYNCPDNLIEHDVMEYQKSLDCDEEISSLSEYEDACLPDFMPGLTANKDFACLPDCMPGLTANEDLMITTEQAATYTYLADRYGMVPPDQAHKDEYNRSEDDELEDERDGWEPPRSRLHWVWSRVDQRFQLHRRVEQMQLQAELNPLQTFGVVVAVMISAVPIAVFTIFTLCSLFFTLSGFLIVESVLLLMGLLTLGVVVVVSGGVAVLPVIGMVLLYLVITKGRAAFTSVRHYLAHRLGQRLPGPIQQLKRRNTTPSSQPLTVDEASVPSSQPLTVDEASVPSSQPLAVDQASTPNSQPLALDEASAPTPEIPEPSQVKAVTSATSIPQPQTAAADVTVVPATAVTYDHAVVGGHTLVPTLSNGHVDWEALMAS